MGFCSFETGEYGESMKERRRYERFPVEIPAVVRIVATGEQFEGEVKDLSKGGAFIHGVGPVLTGTRVEIILDLANIHLPGELPIDQMKQPITSTVRWTRGTLSSFGVEFSKPVAN